VIELGGSSFLHCVTIIKEDFGFKMGFLSFENCGILFSGGTFGSFPVQLYTYPICKNYLSFLPVASLSSNYILLANTDDLL
jgi:hypothetical protein